MMPVIGLCIVVFLLGIALGAHLQRWTTKPIPVPDTSVTILRAVAEIQTQLKSGRFANLDQLPENVPMTMGITEGVPALKAIPPVTTQSEKALLLSPAGFLDSIRILHGDVPDHIVCGAGTYTRDVTAESDHHIYRRS